MSLIFFSFSLFSFSQFKQSKVTSLYFSIFLFYCIFLPLIFTHVLMYPNKALENVSPNCTERKTTTIYDIFLQKKISSTNKKIRHQGHCITKDHQTEVRTQTKVENEWASLARKSVTSIATSKIEWKKKQ